MATHNKPANTLRCGNIKATIWENTSENGAFFATTFSRPFKDHSGAWRNGTSFGLNDLEALLMLAREAREWIAVGEGAFSVPNVKVGKEAIPYTCRPNQTEDKTKDKAKDETDCNEQLPICPESDLMAYPKGMGPSSITVSVVETGNVGIDFDQTTAELRAIKEALGPAIKDSLKEALK